jgi:hypothetical protein
MAPTAVEPETDKPFKVEVPVIERLDPAIEDMYYNTRT